MIAAALWPPAASRFAGAPDHEQRHRAVEPRVRRPLLAEQVRGVPVREPRGDERAQQRAGDQQPSQMLFIALQLLPRIAR
jgi:hypothetical protein